MNITPFSSVYSVCLSNSTLTENIYHSNIMSVNAVCSDTESSVDYYIRYKSHCHNHQSLKK